MSAKYKFDATKVKPRTRLDPLPIGTYVAAIATSDMRENMAGTGSYLELVFEIDQPDEHRGRRLWQRLNVVNPSEKAVEIAHAELSAICHAAGVLQIENTADLHYKPMTIEVTQRRRQETGYLVNEIVGYQSYNSEEPTDTHAAAQSPADISF
jgi:hypothetical protein